MKIETVYVNAFTEEEALEVGVNHAEDDATCYKSCELALKNLDRDCKEVLGKCAKTFMVVKEVLEAEVREVYIAPRKKTRAKSR